MMTKEERAFIKEQKRQQQMAAIQAAILEKEIKKNEREEMKKIQEKMKNLDLTKEEDMKTYLQYVDILKLHASVDETVGRNEANVQKEKTAAVGKVVATIGGGIVTIASIVTASKCTYAPNLGNFIHKPKVG